MIYNVSSGTLNLTHSHTSIAQLSRMLPLTLKRVRVKFTPETAVGNVLITLIYQRYLIAINENHIKAFDKEMLPK